jgi:hypothetical protein
VNLPLKIIIHPREDDCLAGKAGAWVRVSASEASEKAKLALRKSGSFLIGF